MDSEDLADIQALLDQHRHTRYPLVLPPRFYDECERLGLRMAGAVRNQPIPVHADT